MITSHKDLDVWKKSRLLVKAVYETTSSFPGKEQYGLTAQIRRAVISIPANIAEGNARKTRKDYAHFVSIAFGSASELDALLLLACDLNYLSAEKAENILNDIKNVGMMLNRLRSSLDSNANESRVPSPESRTAAND